MIKPSSRQNIENRIGFVQKVFLVCGGEKHVSETVLERKLKRVVKSCEQERRHTGRVFEKAVFQLSGLDFHLAPT